MSENSKDELPSFINNDVDPKTRANIIGLDQKLRGIQAEVQAKLKNLDLSKDQVGPDYKEALTNLLSEINMAIEGIDILVNLTTSDDQEAVAELLHSEEAKEFNQMLEDSLERIKQINNNF